MSFFDRLKPIPDKEIEGLHLPPKEPLMDGDEEVVSVWEGSGNMRFHQRRYFEGYTQYETLGPNGELHRHNIYVGYWYIQQLTKAERTRHKLANIAMLLVGAAAMVYASTRAIPANNRWFAGIPAFASFYAFIWAAVSVVNEFTVPQKRTIGDYRVSSLGVKRSGLMALASGGVLFLITVVYLLLGAENPSTHLIAAGCELVSTACGFGLWWYERKVVYKKQLSELAGKFTM